LVLLIGIKLHNIHISCIILVFNPVDNFEPQGSVINRAVVIHRYPQPITRVVLISK
jgi:hypothetical protein